MSPGRIHTGRVSLAAAASLAVAFAALAVPARPLKAQPGTDAVTDALGRDVGLEDAPYGRIVSLVPSVTDLLVALGAAERLVGRTRYDTGAEVRDLPSVGGPLTPGLERLVGLRPELVIAWPDARERGAGARLEELGPAVYFAESSSVGSVDRLLRDLGALVGRRAAADSLRRVLACQLRAVARAVEDRPPVRAAHLIWPDPLFAAGAGSYLDSLMRVAGGRNALGDAPGAWPRVSLEVLVAARPEVILLGGGADHGVWTALRERPAWRGLEAARAGRVHPVPPELFHRPGPELGRAATLLARRLHPGVEVPDPEACVPPP